MDRLGLAYGYLIENTQATNAGAYRMPIKWLANIEVQHPGSECLL